LVTQPVAGEFKAFSAVCAHVGCLLDKVANGAIDCPCHGSTFRIADGGVVTGPATQPLTSVPITITASMITLMYSSSAPTAARRSRAVGHTPHNLSSLPPSAPVSSVTHAPGVQLHVPCDHFDARNGRDVGAS
jgi:hypothetical protein